MSSSAFRYLPNAISLFRLSSVPVLLWLAIAGADSAFVWLLVLVGSSDMLDGWLARRFGWVSRLGALLDSIADMSIVLVVLLAIVLLHPEVFVDYGWVVWSVVGIWGIVNIIGLLRYHRLASFHTEFGRIGITIFGVFVLVLFFYGFVPWVLLACGAVCFLAGVESLLLVLLIDRWTPNLRGGLYAVLRTGRPGPPGSGDSGA